MNADTRGAAKRQLGLDREPRALDFHQKQTGEKLMQSVTQIFGVSKKALWAGRIMSVLPALFLLMDGVMKLFKPAVVVQATLQLGYPESVILPLGIVLLTCTVLYLVPRTSVLGAILLTGYLGGAVATHVRVGESLFSIVFPIIFGVLIWGGLYLREPRLRALIPLQEKHDGK
jgi:hypothetical protein